MRLRWATIAAAVTGLAVIAPAQAREEAITGVATAPGIGPQGFRVAEASNGFQLVEHGIWKRPKDTTLPAAAIVEAGRIHLPYRYAKSESRRPSGFRRASYLPHVYAAETQYALPAGLLDALVWTESRYNPLAISKAGAAGLGQLMPGTARDLGISNRFDPMPNIFGAARYLRQMLDKFGVVHLAIAAYNAGPGAVERAGGIPHNGETPAYVRSVLRHWRF
ncbi:MAG: lytic transglycosylase [Novosphingobium sp. 28-62-57]|uniref:lytic transglycosylase domain-containing protein n=1 Tax=Novosphingobium sp. 28-62-57 TaxID=1970409 RepID=UPI000BD3D9A4|nr:lytic transglycosylase domain-containing protein [Novosphingobium sp. 28-62-57]OYZ12613.1 MAG: lytic transglycosylase [Novosphingobium sp. 28-62-57]